VKIQQIIKEVADNLQIPYNEVNKVIRFAFSSASSNIKDKKPLFNIRYIGRFKKKLTKREVYKKYITTRKNENN
jgi:hypothetical protein